MFHKKNEGKGDFLRWNVMESTEEGQEPDLAEGRKKRWEATLRRFPTLVCDCNFRCDWTEFGLARQPVECETSWINESRPAFHTELKLKIVELFPA